jgi:hypothetical protein
VKCEVFLEMPLRLPYLFLGIVFLLSGCAVQKQEQEPTLFMRGKLDPGRALLLSGWPEVRGFPKAICLLPFCIGIIFSM